MDSMEMSSIASYMKGSNYKGILGIDLGETKIGVAYTDLRLKVVLPIEVIEFKGDTDILIDRLEEIIRQRKVALILVGVASKESKKKYSKLISLINSLAQKISSKREEKIKIVFGDEAYTTSTANEMLKEYGIKRKKRNRIDDMVAAQLIIESFLAKLKRYN